MSDGMALQLPGPHPIRVAVAADHHLVAESVRAALLTRGLDAVAIRWPSVDEPRGPGASLNLRRRWAVGPPPGVAILMSDLSGISQVYGAQMLISGLAVPWLVLAGVPTGPAWGALYEQGAALVVPTDTSLDSVCELLSDMYVGRSTPEAAQRRELIRSWRNFAQHRGELTARLDSLTGREDEVLQQLYEGLAVRVIAERGEVTESTVRSQVKAILRKLDVNSQIAAVAAYQEVQASTSIRQSVRAGGDGSRRPDKSFSDD
jgi:DNA-binding NarL/FixJ family response regulator